MSMNLLSGECSCQRKIVNYEEKSFITLLLMSTMRRCCQPQSLNLKIHSGKFILFYFFKRSSLSERQGNTLGQAPILVNNTTCCATGATTLSIMTLSNQHIGLVRDTQHNSIECQVPLF
jgi:hypothetical protein